MNPAVTTRATATQSAITRLVSSLRVADVAPALVLAIYGATWIMLHASPGRGFSHTVFQSIALAENVVAVLLVRRKPLGSLLGILVVYLLVDLEPTTLPPLLFVLASVAALDGRRSIVIAGAAAAGAMLAMPPIHGTPVNVTSASWHLALGAAAVCAGLYARSRRMWVRPRRHT